MFDLVGYPGNPLFGFPGNPVSPQTVALSAPQSSTAVFGQATEDANGGGGGRFPLAAPAGKDSGAMKVAPPGAVNTGLPDEATWMMRRRLSRRPTYAPPRIARWSTR